MDPYVQPYLAQSDAAAAGGGFMSLLFMVVVYLVATVPVFKIAQRLNQENAWMAFVPIANLYLLTQMAGKDWWWMLLMFIPLINIVIAIILFMGVAENLGHPSWMGILMIIPLINLAILYYWAFGPAPVATRY